MAKWVFYVLVFVYMCYRAVYGARYIDTSIVVDQIQYKDNGFINSGTRKTIECRAPNKNQKLEWINPYGDVVKRIPASRVFAQEHFATSSKGTRSPSLVLTFEEMLPSDTGLYQCQSGEQKKSVRVCVIKPVKFEESEDTPTEVTIEAGRSITLACQAKGDPEPIVVWGRKKNSDDDEFVHLTEDDDNPKYRVNRRYKVEGYESLLTVTNVTPEDGGVYYCIATQESPMLENCTNSDSRNITLQVTYKPEFKNEDDIKYVYGVYNEIVDMKCEAKGWPTPTYRWFKELGGDGLYEFDKTKIVFSEEPPLAILAVTASPTTYGNIYKCTASNNLGETEKLFKLLKREKPWKPDHIEPVGIGGSVIYFNVTWDDAAHFPVDSFTVQYIPSSEVKSRIPERSDWLHAEAVEIEVEEDDEESGEGMVIRITELEPETEYFVRVRAINKAGQGPWSEAIDVTTTNEDNPESGPEEDKPEDEKEVSETATEVDSNNGMFYGVFFAGAILIVLVVSMFVMRMV